MNFELELERIGLGILCSVFVSLSIPLLNPYLCTYTYTVFSLYMLSRKGNAHEPWTCSRFVCLSVCLFVQETYLPTGASKRRTKGTSGTSGIHTWI